MQDTVSVMTVFILQNVVLPIGGVALTWASLKIPGWISSHVKNARAAGILTRLAMLAETVVQEVQQTVVSAMDKDNPPADQLKAARDAALATLKSHLGDEGLKEIEDVLGLTDQDAVVRLLVSFIESAVHTLKNKGKS
jgi:hypothetical protein